MISYTSPLICPPTRREILREVSAERDRQDAKWGGVPGLERRDDHTYAAVLGEEFGEVCQAWLERDTDALRAELVQAAAVAIAWVEELDNGGSLPRPAQAKPAPPSAAGREQTGGRVTADRTSAPKGARVVAARGEDLSRFPRRRNPRKMLTPADLAALAARQRLAVLPVGVVADGLGAKPRDAGLKRVAAVRVKKWKCVHLKPPCIGNRDKEHSTPFAMGLQA